MYYSFRYRILSPRATPFQLVESVFEPLFDNPFAPTYYLMDESDGRPAPRKKITKSQADDSDNNTKQRGGGGGSSAEPVIPERTSSFSGHGLENNENLRRVQRTGSVPDAQAGENADCYLNAAAADAGRDENCGGVEDNHDDGGGDDNGGGGGGGNGGGDQNANEEPANKSGPTSQRPDKGKEKLKRGQQNKKKRNQPGKAPAAAETGNQQRGQGGRNNDISNGVEGLTAEEYAFVMGSIEGGGQQGDGAHHHNNNNGGGEGDGMDDDDDPVIRLDNFPAQPTNPPAATRGMGRLEQYLQIASNDRHGLQQTVRALVETLQQEQLRRAAAEERLAAVEADLAAYRELAGTLKDEADRHKRGHTQVLRDLNRFKAGQGFSQMADDFLTQKALELRQDIRDFAIQYFHGPLPAEAAVLAPAEPSGGGDGPAASKLGDFMRGISPVDPFQTFLLSDTRCASAVEAFVWVVLSKTVFGGWYWAGGGRLALHDVFAWMRPNDFSYALLHADRKEPADLEADRRFYTWRATTAKLVSERCSILVRENLRNKLVEEICATIAPYLRAPNDGSHEEELCNIVTKAVAFDRDTSQQAARLEWVFCRAPAQIDNDKGGGNSSSGGGGGDGDNNNNSSGNENNPDAPRPTQPYDPRVMELQMWETPTAEETNEVLLVVAPGLRKRGRSNGEDFSVETMLLKMEVSCERVTDVSEHVGR